MRGMFMPRPPLEFSKPLGPAVEKKDADPFQPSHFYTGLSQYLDVFEKNPPPPKEPFELPAERRARVREQMLRLQKEKNDLLAADWDPHKNPNATE
jgi:U1 small nuclear ribonucleoprotein of 70kDa MW N terminal